MRKETSNQFTDGLISDLNPINTPNTVLTDSLNGTIITYNGNEMILQNDMGNYKLRDCRLKPNYIPVGIKEHGDILYIVSYNPLDKHVEVGSYPSPLIISRADEDNSDLDLKSIIQTQILDEGKHEKKYTELMKSSDRSIIFNGDKFFLNPGDEYCMQVSGETPHRFETYDYYILDNESGSHNVTNEIVLDKDPTQINYQHVPWTIPGWIYSVIRLAEIASMSLNVREFYVPKTGDDILNAQFNFNIKLNINDEYLTGKQDNEESIVEQWCEKINDNNIRETDISFRIQIEKLNGDKWEPLVNEDLEFNLKDSESSDKNELTYTPEECGWTEWYDSAVIIFKNISGNIPNLKENDQIRVKVVPILSQKNYKIVYDNLEQSLIFDLKSIDDKPWDLGSSFYKFYLNNTEDAQIINFNIDGPLVTSSRPELFYRIHKDKYVKAGATINDWVLGDNHIEIKFNDTFKPEDIYLIEFIFKFEEERKSFKRALITSKVFENFAKSEYTMYDEIPSNEWLKLYEKYWKIEYTPEITFTRYFETLEEPISTNKYSSFHKEKKEDFTNSYTYKYEFSLKGSPKEECLTGPIWDGLKSKNEYSYFNGVGEVTESELKPILHYKQSYTYAYTYGNKFDFANLEIENLSEIETHEKYTSEPIFYKEVYFEYYMLSTNQTYKYYVKKRAGNKILKTMREMPDNKYINAVTYGSLGTPSFYFSQEQSKFDWEKFPIGLLKTTFEFKDETPLEKDKGYQTFTTVHKKDHTPFTFEKSQSKKYFYWLVFRADHESEGDGFVLIPFYAEVMTDVPDFQKLVDRISIVKSDKDPGIYYQGKMNFTSSKSDMPGDNVDINITKSFTFNRVVLECKYTDCLEATTFNCSSLYCNLTPNPNHSFENVNKKFEQQMQNYNTQSDRDYTDWTNSIYFKEYNSRKYWTGMYIKGVDYSGDDLLQQLNKCYWKNKYFGLSNMEDRWQLDVVDEKGKKAFAYIGFAMLKNPEVYINWFTDET